MAISYIGADVDCKMTEFAVEKNGKITDRDRVPTDIRSMSNFLSTISGRKIMTVEEGVPCKNSSVLKSLFFKKLIFRS